MLRSVKLVALLVLSSSTASFGVEFRGAGIGKTCDSIEQYEQELGNVPSDGSTDDWYSYTVLFLGREAGVVYTCNNSILQSAFYSLVFPSLSEANQFFSVALEYLKSEYGRPQRYELKAGYGSIGYWYKENATIQLAVTNKDDVQANVSICKTGSL